MSVIRIVWNKWIKKLLDSHLICLIWLHNMPTTELLMPSEIEDYMIATNYLGFVLRWKIKFAVLLSMLLELEWMILIKQLHPKCC